MNLELRCHARPPGVRSASASASVPWHIPLCIFGRKGGKDKKRGWNGGEKEKERKGKKKEASTYAWQKIDASCALTPRGFFRATWYRPVERSRATRTPVNVLSGGSSSLFFKHLFLRVPSCACITCSISFARVFDYGCLVLRRRARATFASATAPLNREHRQLLRCIPCSISCFTHFNSKYTNAHALMR